MPKTWFKHYVEIICARTNSKNKGNDSYCRPLVNCSRACAGVTQIDVVHADDMTKEMFAKAYAHRGQPLVVRNATQVSPLNSQNSLLNPLYK